MIGNYNSDFSNNIANDSRELIHYLLETLHEELNISKKEYSCEDDDINWKINLYLKSKIFHRKIIL